MKNTWYNTGSGEASWYAPVPVQKKKKKRRWILPLVLGLCVVAGAIAFAVTHFYELALFGYEPPIESTEADYPADYRDLLRNYYTSYSKADECTVPRKTAPVGTELPLCELPEETLTLNELYERCSPSIVAIRAYEEDSTSSYFWGTGVIMTEDGYIVTNSHIVEGTARAEVTLHNGDTHEAFLVGNDSRSDIAVLKIEASGLTAAEFAYEECSVGDSVAAIGNPLQATFTSSMTEGIISGINRNLSYNGAGMTLLQTTAPINSGNSGGALFNMYGQVVGVTNMKMSSTYVGAASIEGIGFAIPTRVVKAMADSILQNGQVLGRPALGVLVGTIPQQVREHYSLPEGLYVSEIYKGSGFYGSELQIGDIILAFNGHDTVETTDITSRLTKVGDEVTLKVWRLQGDGTTVTFEISGLLADVADVY